MKLRALEPEDLSFLYDLENDERLWHYGRTNVPYSRFVLRQYLETQSCDIYQDGQLRLVIEHDRKAIGTVDLCNFDAAHSRAEVGIVIAPDCQGKGLAAEALSLLHEYAKAHLPLHQLYALVGEANQPSLHLFAKCGYRQTATLQDWLQQQDGTFQSAIVFQLVLS